MEKILENIRKKFSDITTNYILEKFGAKSSGCKVVYRKYVVIQGTSKNVTAKVRELLGNEGIRVIHVDDFLRQILERVVREYSSKHRTLADSCWFLNMMRALGEAGLLNIS